MEKGMGKNYLSKKPAVVTLKPQLYVHFASIYISLHVQNGRHKTLACLFVDSQPSTTCFCPGN